MLLFVLSLNTFRRFITYKTLYVYIKEVWLMLFLNLLPTVRKFYFNSILLVSPRRYV